MKRLITGVQPSGIITLGNYSTIKNVVKLQKDNPDFDFLIFIADLHAITVNQDRTKLRQNIRNLAAMYIACGLDPKKTHLFIQSEVPMHNQLGYVMECIAPIGELERMTQYKDKKVKQVNGINTSLLTYPALMAGDILLYDIDFVPVGDDQKQHLELTRNLAERFNSRFGETFKIPEPLISNVGARIMSLNDPHKKMSKSDPTPKSYISVLDDENIIKNRIRQAVTDSEGVIYYDVEKKPGISNLLNIYSFISGDDINTIVEKYQNATYQQFKEDLAEIVANELIPVQKRYNEILKSDILDQILDEGRDYAIKLAYKKIMKVYHKMGIGRKR